MKMTEGWRGLVVKVFRDPNIVGSIPVAIHFACDLGQVTLLRLPRRLNET
jgi:hypothetical protein